MERVNTVSCCVCVTSCILVILGCVYMTVLIREIRDLHVNCAHGQNFVKASYDNDVNVGMTDEVTAVQNFDQTLNSRFRRLVPNSVGEGKPRHKRKTNRKGKSSKKGKKSKVRAGHYVTMVTDEYVNKKLASYDDNTAGTINVFKPSTWTTKKLEPFSLQSNGEFKAKFKGIYFVYAQVLFFDNKKMQMVVINHKVDKTGTTDHVLSCTTVGGDYNKQASLNSCSMHGLISLNKNDILTVKNENSDVMLHLRKATTYFGAFVVK